MAPNTHLSHAVFEAGIWRAVDAKWDGIREAFHGFDPAQVAAMTLAEIAATENDPRVIRNKAKIRATVENAREVLAVLDSYGSIRAYFASFPDAHAASADMRRRFQFLGNTGVWRLLTGAARDIAVDLDGTRLHLEPGQRVIPHGIGRGLTTGGLNPGRQP